MLALPNTPLGLPAKVARDWIAVPLPLSLGLTAALLGFLPWPPAGSRTVLAYASIVLGLYYVATIIPDAIDASIPDFLGLSVEVVALGYGALVWRERRTDLTTLALLFVAPLAVGLGTFNNQWFQLNFSMAFPFLALFVLVNLDRRPWRRAGAAALAIIGPIGVMLLSAWAPYSLPASILEQQVKVSPPLARGYVLVDEETADFVRATKGAAHGALLVDLSGTGPGVDAVLGGRAPVLPWLNPATPTWPDVVWSRLRPQERAVAWFVLPAWPGFEQSRPFRWLMANKSRYCGTSLPTMTFWSEERNLQLWRPCKRSAPRPPAALSGKPL